jgi:5-methyltetrahydropteroyltriglutamate--homocysteine methyltransferase
VRVISTAPPFRAEHVGSLLRPAALKAARARFAAGEIDAAALRAAEDRAIADAIRWQEEVGLRAITDGELRRAYWHYDFLEGLDGVEAFVPAHGAAFKGAELTPRALRVTGKIGFSGHPMLDDFRFVQAHTTRTAKMTIPAPSALHYRFWREAVSREIYPSMEEFFADLGRAYAAAVAAFGAAGCRYLQLDEVFLAYLCDPEQQAMLRARGEDPEALKRLYAELINAAIAGAPPGMVTAMHLCRGNFRSTFVASGGYEPIADLLFNGIGVGVYFMEYDTERAGGFEPLRHLPAGKHAVLGLVSSKTGRMETRDEILRRIEDAARFAPLDRLCLSPQCGFASTQEGNLVAEAGQWDKLGLVVQVAREVWPEG